MIRDFLLLLPFLVLASVFPHELGRVSRCRGADSHSACAGGLFARCASVPRKADGLAGMLRVAVLFCFPWLLGAQLIPKGPNTPVVFLNGYQLNCSGNTFAASFGNADAVLQSNGIFSVFINNCDVPGKPSLEALGIAFGRFLAGLKFSDGSAVSQVDVVAHSMGGLIVRSYLAGMQDTNPAIFTPPATPGIRKAIFLATPQFGTGLTTYLGVDAQSQELTIGSRFLFDLNTWNDNTDDLRGVDALAVVGNGGTGLESFIPGFDDGLATLTSTSLGFA